MSRLRAAGSQMGLVLREGRRSGMLGFAGEVRIPAAKLASGGEKESSALAANHGSSTQQSSCDATSRTAQHGRITHRIAACTKLPPPDCNVRLRSPVCRGTHHAGIAHTWTRMVPRPPLPAQSTRILRV